MNIHEAAAKAVRTANADYKIQSKPKTADQKAESSGGRKQVSITSVTAAVENFRLISLRDPDRAIWAVWVDLFILPARQSGTTKLQEDTSVVQKRFEAAIENTFDVNRVDELLSIVRKLNEQTDPRSARMINLQLANQFSSVDPSLVALKLYSAMRGNNWAKSWFKSLASIVSDYFVPMTHLALSNETIVLDQFRPEVTQYYDSDLRKQTVEVMHHYRDGKIGTDLAAFLHSVTAYGITMPPASSDTTTDATDPSRNRISATHIKRSSQFGSGGRFTGVRKTARIGATGPMDAMTANTKEADNDDVDDDEAASAIVPKTFSDWSAVSAPSKSAPKSKLKSFEFSSNVADSKSDWRSKSIAPSAPLAPLPPLTIADLKTTATTNFKPQLALADDIERYYRFFPTMAIQLNRASSTAKNLIFDQMHSKPAALQQQVEFESRVLQEDFIDSDSAKPDPKTGWIGTRWNHRHVKMTLAAMRTSHSYMVRNQYAKRPSPDGAQMSFLTRKVNGKVVNTWENTNAETRAAWIEYMQLLIEQLRICLADPKGVVKSQLEASGYEDINVLLSLFNSRSHYNHMLASNAKTWMSMKVGDWSKYRERAWHLGRRMHERLVASTVASSVLDSVRRRVDELNNPDLTRLIENTTTLASAVSFTAANSNNIPIGAFTYRSPGVQTYDRTSSNEVDAQKQLIQLKALEFPLVSYEMLMHQARQMTSTFIMHQTIITTLYQELALHFLKSTFCEMLLSLEKYFDAKRLHMFQSYDRKQFMEKTILGVETMSQKVRDAATNGVAQGKQWANGSRALIGIRFPALLAALMLPSGEFSITSIIQKKIITLYTFGKKRSEEYYQMTLTGSAEPSLELHIFQQQTELIMRVLKDIPVLLRGLWKLTDGLLADINQANSKIAPSIKFEDLVSMKSNCEGNLLRALFTHMKRCWSAHKSIPLSLTKLAYIATCRSWYTGALVQPDSSLYYLEHEYSREITAFVNSVAVSVVSLPNVSLII